VASLPTTFGLSVGYAHTDTPIQEDQVGLYDPGGRSATAGAPGVPAGTYYSDGIKALRHR
jgi:hypothetical protein